MELEMEPVLTLWLLGFGSVGLGWLLEDKIGSRTTFSRILYGLGFLISGIGAAMVIQVAINPLQYGLTP
jgi:hypothetical protein